MKKSSVASRKRQARRCKKQLKNRKRSLRQWLARFAESRRRALAALANALKTPPRPDQVDPDAEDYCRLPKLGNHPWDAATSIDVDTGKSSYSFGADLKQTGVLQKVSVTAVTFKLPEGEPLTMGYTQPSRLLQPLTRLRAPSALPMGRPLEFILVQSITLKPLATSHFPVDLLSAAIKITALFSINLKQLAEPEKPPCLRIPGARSRHPGLLLLGCLPARCWAVLRRTPPAAVSKSLNPTTPVAKKKMTLREFYGESHGCILVRKPIEKHLSKSMTINVLIKKSWPHYKKCCFQKRNCLFRHHRQGRSYAHHVKNERYFSQIPRYSPVRVKKSLSKAVGADQVTQNTLGRIAGRNQRSRPLGKISYPTKSSYGSYRIKAKLLGLIPSRVEKPPRSFKDHLAERGRLAGGSSPALAAPLVQKMAAQTQEVLYNSGQSEGISASVGTNSPLLCRPLH